MILLLIEAVVLIFLLKTIIDDDVSLLSASLLTIMTTFGMNGLVYLFAALLGEIFSPLAGGILALLLGGGIAAVGLGAAVSLLYGAPLKTASLVSLIFLGVCIGLSLGYRLLFGF